MTNAELYNIQTGKTIYKSSDPFDYLNHTPQENYILGMVKARELANEYRQKEEENRLYQRIITDGAKDIEKELRKNLNDILS